MRIYSYPLLFAFFHLSLFNKHRELNVYFVEQKDKIFSNFPSSGLKIVTDFKSWIEVFVTHMWVYVHTQIQLIWKMRYKWAYKKITKLVIHWLSKLVLPLWSSFAFCLYHNHLWELLSTWIHQEQEAACFLAP